MHGCPSHVYQSRRLTLAPMTPDSAATASASMPHMRHLYFQQTPCNHRHHRHPRFNHPSNLNHSLRRTAARGAEREMGRSSTANPQGCRCSTICCWGLRSLVVCVYTMPTSHMELYRSCLHKQTHGWGARMRAEIHP